MQLLSLLKKTLIFGFGVVVVSLILSLLVGEFIVKHIMPQQTYDLARAEGLNIFEESPILPYTLQKNVNKFHHLAYTREFTHFASTNSHATRGQDFADEKPADTFRILFLGDSITFGWGVEDEEAYPAVVEKYLNQVLKKDKFVSVEIINAGFTDSNAPDTFYLYYKEIGAKFNPDLVVVDFHPPNDLVDMYYHAWDSVDSQKMPLKISSTTHVPKDGYMVSRKKTKWKYEIPIFRNSHLGILFLNALEIGAPQLVEQIKQTLKIEEDKEPFTMQQNFECLEAIDQKVCPKELWPFFEKVKEMFIGIKRVALENQDELVVTLMPGPDQTKSLTQKSDKLELLKSINPQKFYGDFFKTNAFNYLDLTSALTVQNPNNIFYIRDGHINKLGHEVVARGLTTYLQKTKPDLFDPAAAF